MRSATVSALSDSFLVWNETLPGTDGKLDGKNEASATGRTDEEIRALTVRALLLPAATRGFAFDCCSIAAAARELEPKRGGGCMPGCAHRWMSGCPT